MDTKIQGILIILIFFISLVWANEELKIIPDISKIDQFVGNTHLMTCQGNQPLQWLEPNGRQLTNQKGRVHVEQRSMDLLLLVFDKIEKEDNGIWTCISTNHSAKRNFTLNVYEYINFVNLTLLQTIVENKNEEIFCDVKGNPKPEVIWSFNGKQVEIKGKYVQLSDGLIIKGVTRNDTGEYTCKAFQISETLSNKEERTIRVNVLGVPLIAPKSKAIFYGYLGGFVNLSCAVIHEGNTTHFTWTRKENNSLHQQSITTFDDKFISTIQILINDTSVFGEYQCNATNIVGSTIIKVHLTTGPKPKKPEKIVLLSITSTTITINVKCAKSIDPDIQINSLRFEIITKNNSNPLWNGANVVDYRLNPDNIYEIVDLLPQTHYSLRVASKSVSGFSDWIYKDYSTSLNYTVIINSFANEKATFNCILMLICMSFTTIVLHLKY